MPAAVCRPRSIHPALTPSAKPRPARRHPAPTCLTRRCPWVPLVLLGVVACGQDKPTPPTSPSVHAAAGSAQAKADNAAAAEQATAKAARGEASLAGAKKLLGAFLASGANHAALSAQLKPAAADYAKVFVKVEMAKKAEAVYAGLWQAIAQSPIAPKPGQTALLVWQASTEELRAGKGDAREFPGGYQQAAAELQPGLTFYRFKFVKPGETSGMAFDGLVNLDGRWIIVPKPWRVTG